MSTYCVWSFTSATYYVLLTIGVNSLASRQLAVTTEIFEILSVASLMNNLLVTAAYQFYLLYEHSIHKSKYIFYSINVPVLLLTFTIIVILLSANGSLLTAVVILTFVLVLIGTVGTTLFIINYTKLWFTIKKIKGQIYVTSAREVLARGLLRVLLGYVYLVLLCYHLTASSIKVTFTNKCVEDAQGKRSAWLVLQSILKVFELVLVLQCLVSHIPQRIKRLFKKRTVKQSKKIRPPQSITLKSHQTKHERPIFSLQSKSEVVTEVTNKLTFDYICNSFSETNKTEMQDVRKVEIQKPSEIYRCVTLPIPKQVECVPPVECSSALEYEYLSHTCDVDYSDKRETCLQYASNLCDTTNKSYHKSDDFSTLFVEFNCEPISVSTRPLSHIPHGTFVLYAPIHCCHTSYSQGVYMYIQVCSRSTIYSTQGIVCMAVYVTLNFWLHIDIRKIFVFTEN